MKKVVVNSGIKKQVVDITELVQMEITRQKIGDAVCALTLLHTTCALTTADLDPGTDLDMLDFFQAIVPDIKFRHPHDPAHTPSHILSSLIGTSITLPVSGGKLKLGTWQRVVLIEFDGPRKREIACSFSAVV